MHVDVPMIASTFPGPPIRTAGIQTWASVLGDRNRRTFRKPRFFRHFPREVSGARIVRINPPCQFLVYHMFEPRIKRRKKSSVG